jgi:hypothetical protein
MVVEIYHRDGTGWNRCVFHAGGILEAGPSPYTDEKGKTECPIVAQSCYVDRENNRMGVGETFAHRRMSSTSAAPSSSTRPIIARCRRCPTRWGKWRSEPMPTL